MPVVKHSGNCHVYVDAAADLDMAEKIVVNAKVQRPGVCNAAESLLVHRDVAAAFLPRAAGGCGTRASSCAATAPGSTPGRRRRRATEATEADYATEFLDLIMAVRVVETSTRRSPTSTATASGHTEAIVTRDLAARAVPGEVDASAVIVNA